MPMTFVTVRAGVTLNQLKQVPSHHDSKGGGRSFIALFLWLGIGNRHSDRRYSHSAAAGRGGTATDVETVSECSFPIVRNTSRQHCFTHFVNFMTNYGDETCYCCYPAHFGFCPKANLSIIYLLLMYKSCGYGRRCGRSFSWSSGCWTQTKSKDLPSNRNRSERRKRRRRP